MSASATTKQVESGTFHDCIGNGFDLLRKNIALRDQEEINETVEWLEKEMRSICRQFDETWAKLHES